MAAKENLMFKKKCSFLNNSKGLVEFMLGIDSAAEAVFLSLCLHKFM